jgi:hypothetical protein
MLSETMQYHYVSILCHDTNFNREILYGDTYLNIDQVLLQ